MSSLTLNKPKPDPRWQTSKSPIMITINNMKANYKRIEDIKVDIRSTDIEEILKFDNHGRYGFYKCESCGGPILGHMEVKCRALNGVRCNMVTENSFEDCLEIIPEFRVAERKEKRSKEF